MILTIEFCYATRAVCNLNITFVNVIIDTEVKWSNVIRYIDLFVIRVDIRSFLGGKCNLCRLFF